MGVGLLVATPAAGGLVTHDYLHAVAALRVHLERLGWGMELVSRPDGLVTRSRNAFASQVVRDPRFTHLLMLDADVTVEPEGIERLVRSGHDVAACAVALRRVNWDRVDDYLAARPGASAHELRATATEYAVRLEPGRRIQDGFLEVRAVGSAAMLISREALIRLAGSGLVQRAERGLRAADGHDDGWAFFDPFVDAEGTYLSEDYAFCDRWRASGGSVWLDVRTPTWHVGPVPVPGDIASSLEAARTLGADRGLRQASAPGTLLPSSDVTTSEGEVPG